jgi:hypothetical protein
MLAAIAAGSSWFHPGQWRKHRLLEYWSCCQRPAQGDKEARGCQPVAAGAGERQ